MNRRSEEDRILRRISRKLSIAGLIDKVVSFKIFASDEEGEERFVVDGGLTDWTQKLLNDRKERFMTSGMGTERFLAFFKARSDPQS